MKRTLTSLLLLGALVALGSMTPTPAASPFVTSTARLALAPQQVDSPCGSLALGGALELTPPANPRTVGLRGYR